MQVDKLNFWKAVPTVEHYCKKKKKKQQVVHANSARDKFYGQTSISVALNSLKNTMSERHLLPAMLL